MTALFEWPNIKARDKLLANKEAQKLFPTRDAILTSIKLAYYTVDKDVSVTFKEDKKLAGRSMISSKLNFARYVSCVILRSRVLGVYMTCAAVLYCCAEGNKI